MPWLALFMESKMFNLLSNQAKLLTLLNSYSDDDLDTASKNLKLTITLLSCNTTELLENRRIHGVLLPHEAKGANKLSPNNIQALSCEQLLLKSQDLLQAINTLCLTEAIIIKNNFSNCLEVILEGDITTLPLMRVTESVFEKPTVIDKSNVSPIRLTEIKHRLAQAVLSPQDKQERVKSKLNKLLSDPKSNISKLA